MTRTLRAVARFRFEVALIAAITAAIPMWGPSAATAATPLGQTSNTGLNCGSGAGAAYVQGSTGGPPSYAAPTSGVITSWSHEAQAGDGQSARLKVYRPTADPLKFVVVGHSASESLTPSSLNTFPRPISVEAGNVLGIAQTSSNIRCIFMTGNAGDVQTQGASIGDDPPGATSTFINSFSTYRVNVTARLEPDCDADGLGDETQDPDISSCIPQPQAQSGRTLTLDASRSKVTKGKKVTLSGQLDAPENGVACESGQLVELQRKKPSQTVFATVEQLQTTATGNFSIKEKVKKTFEYRAVVAESAECQPAASNTEKVKVKKRK